jgi:hypothetical protein
MEALRLIAKANNHQLVIDLPPSMDDCVLEVIVLPARSEQIPAMSERRRRPSPMLAGTVGLKDDLLAAAIPETDWDALQW